MLKVDLASWWLRRKTPRAEGSAPTQPRISLKQLVSAICVFRTTSEKLDLSIELKEQAQTSQASFFQHALNRHTTGTRNELLFLWIRFPVSEWKMDFLSCSLFAIS